MVSTLPITHSKGKGKVLSESLRLTTDYLENEERVVVANSKLESVDAKSSKLRKDLIEAMDKANRAKEKIKELNEVLRVEKMLVVQKDEEIQTAFLRTSAEWTMKHHNLAIDFSNLNFETIDTEILADEAKELEETTDVATIRGTYVANADPSQRDEVAVSPVE
nr:hypothetical protein CFP56_36918 [Quercus suber]